MGWWAAEKLRTFLSNSPSFLLEVRDKVNEKVGEILELLLCAWEDFHTIVE